MYDQKVWQAIESAVVQKYMSLLIKQYDFSEVLIDALDITFKRLGEYVEALSKLHHLNVLFYYTKIRLFMESRNYVSKDDPRLKVAQTSLVRAELVRSLLQEVLLEKDLCTFVQKVCVDLL